MVTPLLSVEAMQATTKLLRTSMPQQILYTIFKAIGTPLEHICSLKIIGGDGIV